MGAFFHVRGLGGQCCACAVPPASTPRHFPNCTCGKWVSVAARVARVVHASVASLLGGAVIGLAASLLWLSGRKVAGISGILASAVTPFSAPAGRTWRWMFLLGLVAGGTVMRWSAPQVFGPALRGVPGLLVAGFAVGLGTRLSGGCTSGHGVCGLSRLSPRSLAATVTFVLAGVITVLIAGTGGSR